MHPSANIERRASALGQGDGLAFILGGFRSGTTLLRKLLDSHSRIESPAETWFLLPLLNLWDGQGAGTPFEPKQAAAAIRGHLNQDQFIACCQAFAGRFYAERVGEVEWFIDKTPLYLEVAMALPRVFPSAKFIVLARDPRGLCWSRHTWAHASSPTPESRFAGVAQDTARLANFVREFGDRSVVVRYEKLCAAPDSACKEICNFLDVHYEPAMIEYGRSCHDEGYGDEGTLTHSHPHTESIDRWLGPNGLNMNQQSALLDLCAADLAALNMGELAPVEPARRSA